VEAVTVPGEEAAVHIVCVVSRGHEGLGGHRRPGAAAAVEDDGDVALDLGRASGELGQLDVLVPGDAPGGVLVGLANVDELDLRGREQLGDLLGGVVRVHAQSVAIGVPPGPLADLERRKFACAPKVIQTACRSCLRHEGLLSSVPNIHNAY
jgi:hypothetical protein